MCGGALNFMENAKRQNLSLSATDSTPPLHGENNLIIMQRGIHTTNGLALSHQTRQIEANLALGACFVGMSEPMGIQSVLDTAMAMIPNESVMLLVPQSEVKAYLAAVGC